MPTPLQLVLFDLDEVLCHYDRSARVRHIAKVSGSTPEKVRSAIWESGLEGRADAGSLSSEAYLGEIGERLGYALTLSEWLDARSAAMRANLETLAIAKAVSSHCRIAVLTNNCRLVGEYISQLCPPVAELFAAEVYCSASFGAAKPQPLVYQRCLLQLGVAAADTLFIDDLPENARGAAEAGLHAHHFTNADALRVALAGFGLGRTARPHHYPAN